MNQDAPIGIFDSGVGGLSIWREINRLLPSESCIYLADSKHAPYGDRPQEEIIRLSVKNTEILMEEGCKLIVVACNTATTNAIETLRSLYSIPFIGIEPATKPAAIATRSGKIGVLATRGTLTSALFLSTSAPYRQEVEIIERVGTGLVPIIESGKLSEARALLKTYLEPMVEAGVDGIVLGCSHYPFLLDEIRSIVPDHIKIIDSGAPVARHTLQILEAQGLLSTAKTPQLRFYTNTDLEVLESFLTRLDAPPHEAQFLDF
jgi:glutamate racemase